MPDEPPRSDVLDGHAGEATEHEVASTAPPGEPTGPPEQAGLQGEPTTGHRPAEVVGPPFISNEELMEVVVRFAERRGDSCTWDCPAKHGRYCLDGHAEAYSAREILRARGISHRIPLPDPTRSPGAIG